MKFYFMALFFCGTYIVCSPNKTRSSNSNYSVPVYIKVIKDRMRVALKRKNITYPAATSTSAKH
jgi:hypothetical protein